MKVLRICLSIIFTFLLCNAYSVQPDSDSLLSELKYAKGYADSVDIYLKASKVLNYSDVNKSIEYCDIAYEIALRNRYYEGIGLAFSHKGAALARKNEADEKVMEYINNAIKILSYYRSPEIGFTYNSLGNVYLRKNEPVLALDSYLTGVDYAEKLNNENALASLYNNIANVYKKYSKWEDAKLYAIKALEISKKINSKRYLIFSYNHLGDIYVIQDSLDKALQNFNIVLGIYNNNPTDVSICGALSGIAHVYEKQNKYEDAVLYYEKSLAVAEKFDYSFMIANVLEFLSNFYFTMGEYNKVIEYGKRFLVKAREISSSDFELEASRILANSYEKTGNISEAYKYNKVFMKNDSIRETKLRELNSSIFDNELKKREKELLVEKQQKEIEVLNAKEKERLWLQILLIFLLAFSIIGIIGSVIFYQQRIKLKNSRIEQISVQHLQEKLTKELEFKKKEMENLALLIIEKNNFMFQLKGMLSKLKKEQKDDKIINEINNILMFTSQNLNLTEERKELNIYLNSLYQDFYYKLNEKCPELNEYYKRLAVFLRLNFESREIASVLNISVKSVAMSKYRIRKKLNLPESQDLHEYFSGI
jgi:tetratricopeptide (TPR) repeat protein